MSINEQLASPAGNVLKAFGEYLGSQGVGMFKAGFYGFGAGQLLKFLRQHPEHYRTLLGDVPPWMEPTLGEDQCPDEVPYYYSIKREQQ